MTTDSKKNRTTDGKRGAALCRAVTARIAELDMTQKEAAKKVGISEEYFSLLVSGERWFGTIAEDKLRRVADFLNVPYISVMMLAEIIQPVDFYRSSTVEAQVEALFDVLENDKRFVMAVPSRNEWDKAPLSVKLLSVILYQQVSAKDLLEKAQLLKVKLLEKETRKIKEKSELPIQKSPAKKASRSRLKAS